MTLGAMIKRFVTFVAILCGLSLACSGIVSVLSAACGR